MYILSLAFIYGWKDIRRDEILKKEREVVKAKDTERKQDRQEWKREWERKQGQEERKREQFKSEILCVVPKEEQTFKYTECTKIYRKSILNLSYDGG